MFRALLDDMPEIPSLGLSSKCFFSTASSNHSMSMKKELITEALKKFPHRKYSEDRFLVIVSIDIVTSVIESVSKNKCLVISRLHQLERRQKSISVLVVLLKARSLGLLHPESQWLFVLSNTAENSSIVTDFKKLLAEGENIAFVYNITNFREDCKVK